MRTAWNNLRMAYLKHCSGIQYNGLLSYINVKVVTHLRFLYGKKAAHHGQLYAYVELAKVCEHTWRNFQKAIDWTQQAIRCIEEPSYPSYDRAYWKPELEHRLERLRRKQAGDESVNSPED